MKAAAVIPSESWDWLEQVGKTAEADPARPASVIAVTGIAWVFFTHGDGAGGQIQVGIKRVAQLTGCHHSTVSRVRRWLIGAGFGVQESGYRRGTKATWWRAVLPGEQDLSREHSREHTRVHSRVHSDAHNPQPTTKELLLPLSPSVPVTEDDPLPVAPSVPGSRAREEDQKRLWKGEEQTGQLDGTQLAFLARICTDAELDFDWLRGELRTRYPPNRYAEVLARLQATVTAIGGRQADWGVPAMASRLRSRDALRQAEWSIVQSLNEKVR